jgi:hypothetical protein
MSFATMVPPCKSGPPESTVVAYSFQQLSYRLRYLELWYELAIRPTADDCWNEDADLLLQPNDHLETLQQRCWHVRALRNQVLPTPPVVPLEDYLMSMTSQIPHAGQGLFYCPSPTLQDAAVLPTIPAHTLICYYSGHVHNAASARRLVDRSYLMLLHGDVWIDARPCPEVKARYINDPCRDEDCNCMFRADPSGLYAQVISIRTIVPGEELFASYGDAYWAQQPTMGHHVPAEKRRVLVEEQTSQSTENV